MKVERSRRRAGSPEEVSVLTRRLFSAVRNADLSQVGVYSESGSVSVLTRSADSNVSILAAETHIPN